MNDDANDLFHTQNPSATRLHSEKYIKGPISDGLLGLRAVEEALRNAKPNEAIPVPPGVDIKDILVQRHAVHGDFTDDAKTAQALKYIMRQGKNWDDLPSFAAEALDQMQTKIARILAGDFRHLDHWKDLQGYPHLVEERLK